MSVSVADVGGVRTVLIDRPGRLNAVDAITLEKLADAIHQAGSESAVRVVVLSGVGRAFCSGGDLDVEDPFSIARTERTIDAARRLIDEIRRVPQPVVAAVRGPAVGVGVSIALAADLAVVRSDSYFLLPFTSVGLMPDGGATTLVAAAVGRQTAMRMALLGQRVDAAEALSSGLVAAVFDESSFEDGLAEIIRRFAGGARDALASTKNAINDATLSGLDDAFAREREGQCTLTRTADFREAIAAFAEKRSPKFGATVAKGSS
jgi:enoyl-CoA hydratase